MYQAQILFLLSNHVMLSLPVQWWTPSTVCRNEKRSERTDLWELVGNIYFDMLRNWALRGWHEQVCLQRGTKQSGFKLYRLHDTPWYLSKSLSSEKKRVVIFKNSYFMIFLKVLENILKYFSSITFFPYLFECLFDLWTVLSQKGISVED